MAVPANDLCVNAIAILGFPFSVTVDTTGATHDPATPDNNWGSGNSYNGVWYKWVATPGITRLSLTLAHDAGGLSVCSVLTGASCGALVAPPGGPGTNSGNTRIVQDLVEGQTYYFLLTTFTAGGIPAMTFSIAHPVPTGDFCITLLESLPQISTPQWRLHQFMMRPRTEQNA